MVTFRDRVRGVIYSVALGDALGAPVEKLSYQQIKSMYGRVDSLSTKWYKTDLGEDATSGKVRGDGIVTDDTLMTMALVNVYMNLRRHLDAYDMSNEFVKEIAFKKTYIPEYGKEALLIDRLFYPEKYIFVRHALASCDPRQGGIGNMVNCGAAMYMAPIGIVNAGNSKGAYDEAILFAMGHQSSYGLEAAGVLAACVAKAFEPSVTIEEIVATAIHFAKDGTRKAIEDLTSTAKKLRLKNAGIDEAVHAFQKAISNYSPMNDDIHRSKEKAGTPSNYYTPSRLFSIEELPMALAFIVLNDGEYYKSLYDGINSGRDTDSIGVMIGAILGALYGDAAIKQTDKDLLERTNRMDFGAMADQFCEAVVEIIQQDLSLSEKRKFLF